MPPPPPPPQAATPSPKRFIFEKPGPKATPSTQHHTPRGDVATELPTTGQKSVQQFAPIPRFSNPAQRAIHSSSYPPQTPSSTGPDTTGLVEDFEKHADIMQDAKSIIKSEDDDMLDNAPPDMLYTTDHEKIKQQQHYRVDASLSDISHSPKRPRLEQPERVPPSQAPTKSGAARFIIPPSTSQASQASRPTPFLPPPSSARFSAANTVEGGHDSPTRPVFLKPELPTPSEEAAAGPLPEAFSPHRKGQRHVPGGMAAELSSWVIETGQAATQGRRGKGYLLGNDLVREIKINVVRENGNDGGVTFAEGHEGDSGADVKVMLIPGGSGRPSKQEVKNGITVGICASTWDVVIEDETWVIGIDWRVL